jgi:C4-dicarboxylate transporter, DctM subunit
MDWYLSCTILIALMIVFIMTGMPIGFVLGIIGLGGYWIVQGIYPAISMASLLSYSVTGSFILVTVPLFVLMGEFLVMGGVGSELFDALHVWVGHWKGGMAIGTVIACAIFGAMCGSSVATVVTIGLVAVPEMRKRGYYDGYSAGTVTAAGALAPIIPPSIIMIIYGVMTEQSVAYLFVAAIIPGIITMICQCVCAFYLVWRNPTLAPMIEKANWAYRFQATAKIWSSVLVIFLVLGSIYLGVCTPSEAAALGASGTFIIALFRRKLSLGVLGGALSRTVRTSVMIIFILATARMFAQLLTVLMIPHNITNLFLTLQISPWAIFAIVQILWIILGIFIDVSSIIVITTPIVVPPLVALGFNPIWIGTVLMVNMAIAVITPPMAMNIYAAASTFPEIPIERITRGVMPYFAADAVALIIVSAFPQLSLWLPSMMMG